MSDPNERNKEIIEEFRANGGQVGGFFTDRPLLLLHTTGAKSGLPRLNPLVYEQDNDRYVIIASKSGAPTHPDWYYNLVTNPNVTVEVGMQLVEATATIAEEPERSQLYAKMAAKHSFFAEYAQRVVTRTIPVIILTPTTTSDKPYLKQ